PCVTSFQLVTQPGKGDTRNSEQAFYARGRHKNGHRTTGRCWRAIRQMPARISPILPTRHLQTYKTSDPNKCTADHQETDRRCDRYAVAGFHTWRPLALMPGRSSLCGKCVGSFRGETIAPPLTRAAL